MKPLFSKGGRREVYLPGDPRRREFEEQWRESGGDLAQLEGQPLEVDNGEAAKVGNGQWACLQGKTRTTLDPVGSTVRYEMIKLCTRSLRVLVVQTLI